VVRIPRGLASVDRWLVSGVGRASRGQHRPPDTNQRLKLFWGQNLVKKALRNTCDFPLLCPGVASRVSGSLREARTSEAPSLGQGHPSGAAKKPAQMIAFDSI